MAKFKWYYLENMNENIEKLNEETLTKREKGFFIRKNLSELSVVLVELNQFEDHCKRYKGSFFWTVTENLSERLRKEALSKMTVTSKYEKIGLDLYLDFYIQMSSKNVYNKKTIQVNGEILNQVCFKSIRNEILKAQKILENFLENN